MSGRAQCERHWGDDPKLLAVAQLVHARFGKPDRILVVGCGDGTEAAHLATMLDTRALVGIDIDGAFDPGARERVELMVADARKLPFEDESFDLVFSYHTLEHVREPERAIAEMRRVVRADGGFWIGTPNRSRLVGYVGSRDTSAREKILWNLADWKARIRGRFRNELGAHAGFTGDELRRLLRASFREVEEETTAYYALLYRRHSRKLAALERSGLARLAYPALYFAGRP